MKTKKLFIVVLAVALISCLSVSFSSLKVSAAASAIENKTDKIAFLEGAQLRVDEEDEGITSARFEAVIESDLYNSLISDGAYVDGAEMGFAIVPESAFEAFSDSAGYTDYFEFFKAYYGNEKSQISSVIKPSEIYPYKQISSNGEVTYTKYIARAVISLNAEHYAWKYRAFVYYVSDGKTYYSDLSVSRSVVCIADAVINKKSNQENLTEAQIAKLQAIVKDYEAESAHIFSEDGVCTVCGVCEVSGALKKTVYTPEAFAAALSDGKTKFVTLDNDITIDSATYSVTNRLKIENDGLILDLGKNTLTIPNHTLTVVGDNVTLKNGKMVATTTNASQTNGSYAVAVTGTDAKIEGVTFTGGVSATGYLPDENLPDKKPYNANASVTISGCTVTATNYYTVCAQGDADAKIVNSTLIANSGYAFFWIEDSRSSLTYEAATVKFEGTKPLYNSGDVKYVAPVELGAGGMVTTWAHSEAMLKNALEDTSVTDIKLSADITYTSSIVISGNKTLDLNGKTLTATAQPEVNDDSVWTIEDSGENGKITLTGGGIMLNEGKLVLNSGTVYKEAGGNVFLMGAAQFEMNGGSLLAKSSGCIDVGYCSTDKVAKVTISGGTVKTEATDTCAIYVAGRAIIGGTNTGNAEVTISGGTITSGKYAVMVDGTNSSLTVTGGTFNGDIYNKCGTVKLTEGSYTLNGKYIDDTAENS